MLIIPLSWSGRGPLMMVCVLLGIVLGLAIAFVARAPGAGLGTVGPWPFAAGFAFAAVLNFALGFWLNRRSARSGVDPRTGKAVVGPSPHRFWGLPMQWWSVPMLAFAALLLFAEDEKPSRRETAPAAVLRKG